jgi:hypothetical protein
MRYWIYSEPAGDTSTPVYVIMSDEAVLDSYWEYWVDKVQKVGRIKPNKETCIQDWATIHWATEVTPQVLKHFCSAPNQDNS